MAVIKSGASSDTLTIDATSKAARVTLYDTLGNSMGQKATYRAATAALLTSAADTKPFFTFEGSATKTIRIQRIIVSGVTLTTVVYNTIVVSKYSSAASAGTPTALTKVPLDSGSAASTANVVSAWTAGPTVGSLVGAIDAARFIQQASTVAAAALPPVITFDYRGMGGETSGIVLRGTAEGIGLAFLAGPATTPSLMVVVEWTEE